MSVRKRGLAQSVREWFEHSAGGGGTAVETAPPVEAVKTRRAPSRAKKKIQTAETIPEEEKPTGEYIEEPDRRSTGTAVAEAPVEEIAPPPKRPRVAPAKPQEAFEPIA